MSQPLGTVTFMFTDVEGSTRLWESHPSNMGAALARHDEILRTTVAEQLGHVFTTAGDSFAVAFARAEDAVKAAAEVQRRLADEEWPAQTPVRVRMGLHTGEAQERDGDYFGSAVNRAARVMSLASGEQILVTGATHAIAADADLGDLGFLDLGAHRLKGLTKTEVLYQLTGPGLRDDFPPIGSGVALPGNPSHHCVRIFPGGARDRPPAGSLPTTKGSNLERSNRPSVPTIRLTLRHHQPVTQAL